MQQRKRAASPRRLGQYDPARRYPEGVTLNRKGRYREGVYLGLTLTLTPEVRGTGGDRGV